MDWSSESVLEFIELFREETAIWDRIGNSNQNKRDKSEAWLRIQEKFSMQCSIHELKRKRNCLMTAYREYIRKIKESSTSNLDNVYKPSWFAFDAINRFMGPKYGFEIDLKMENKNANSERHERWSRDSDVNSLSIQTESETSQHAVYLQEFNRKRRSSVTQSHPKRQINENVILFRDNDPTEIKDPGNECDLYGQLLSEKLKKMSDVDRLVVMNEIDNLVFKHAVKARSRIKTAESDDLIASKHKNYISPSGSGTKNKNRMTMLDHHLSSDEE